MILSVPQTQAAGLQRWMAEMDVYLRTDDVAIGDLDMLKAQVQESEVGHTAGSLGSVVTGIDRSSYRVPVVTSLTFTDLLYT